MQVLQCFKHITRQRSSLIHFADLPLPGGVLNSGQLMALQGHGNIYLYLEELFDLLKLHFK